MEKKFTYERVGTLSLISDNLGEIRLSYVFFFQNCNYFANRPLSSIMTVIFRRQSLDSIL